MINLVKAAALAAACVLGASAANAVSLDPTSAPTGLSYTGSYSTPSDSNCPGSPCVKMNKNDYFLITADTGYTFDLTSFQFAFDGSAGGKNGLKVDYAPGTPGSFTLSVVSYPAGSVHTYNSGFLPLAGLTSLKFTDLEGGTSLVGNIQVNKYVPVTPTDGTVPLPAASVLLLGALGGFGLVRRRRKAA